MRLSAAVEGLRAACAALADFKKAMGICAGVETPGYRMCFVGATKSKCRSFDSLPLRDAQGSVAQDDRFWGEAQDDGIFNLSPDDKSREVPSQRAAASA